MLRAQVKRQNLEMETFKDTAKVQIQSMNQSHREFELQQTLEKLKSIERKQEILERENARLQRELVQERKDNSNLKHQINQEVNASKD
jgi:hypothetical protein